MLILRLRFPASVQDHRLADRAGPAIHENMTGGRDGLAPASRLADMDTPRPLMPISMNSWRCPAPGTHHAPVVMPDTLEPVRTAGIPPNRPHLDQFAQGESVRRQFIRFRSPGFVEILPGGQARVIFSLVFNSVRQKACRKQVCSDMSSISCATSSGSDVSR